MTFEEIQISHPVEIEVTMNEKQTTLISAIEHKIKDCILLTPIKLNNKPVNFPPECSVSLYYIDGGKVYRWNHVLIKAVRYDNNIYHSIEIKTDAEILNRRGAFRVYIGERMQITSFTANGPKKVTVLIKDISESGFAFLSKEEYTPGRTVRLTLPFSENHELQLTAQIIRTQEEEGKSEILYGCKFVEKNNRLTTYLMKRQQEHQRRKTGQ